MSLLYVIGSLALLADGKHFSDNHNVSLLYVIGTSALLADGKLQFALMI